jgi:hypothetical protein
MDLKNEMLVLNYKVQERGRLNTKFRFSQADQ